MIQWAARTASHCPKAPSSRLRLTSHYILPLRLSQPGAILLPMDRISASHLCIASLQADSTFPQPQEPSLRTLALTCAQAPVGFAQASGGSQALGTGVPSGLPASEQRGVRVARLAVHWQARTTLRAHTLSYLLPIRWARLRLGPRRSAWARSVPGAEPCE